MILMRRFLFVFLDGVGLGPPSTANPLASFGGSAFRALADGQQWTLDLSPRAIPHHTVRSLDATLGMDGLPQSGTGQATLFTGTDCIRRVGRHFGPFPHSATHSVIDRANLFHQIHALPGPTPTAFANAYPPRFFEYAEARGRWPTTTRCCRAASVPLRTLDHLRNGRAVAADLTGEGLRTGLDLDVPRCSPADAGRHLAELSRSHLFTLFEFFHTDKMGHGRMDEAPGVLLRRLDCFFAALLDVLDPLYDTLLVTSDHGNLEALHRKTHTRNSVPLLVYGWAAPFFANATDLTDVTPSTIQALRARTSPPSL
mgnify:FL=1